MRSLARLVLPTLFVLVALVVGGCGASASDAVPAAAATVPATQPAVPYGITNHLDKISTDAGGLVFYGTIEWTDPVIPPFGASALLAGVKDANGTEIPFEDADAGKNPAQGELLQYWAYRLTEPDPTPPFILSMQVKATIPADGGSFTFDPGSNPQVGQEWEVRQDVVVNGETIHVLSAKEIGTEGFFVFTMQSDSDIVGATVTDLAHPPLGGGGGSGGPSVAGVPFPSAFGYRLPLPQGPFTLTFTDVQVLVPGDWDLTWKP